MQLRLIQMLFFKSQVSCLPQNAAALFGIPVDVQVVYGCYDASILVGIVHMHDIMCARARIASDHRLK